MKLLHLDADVEYYRAKLVIGKTFWVFWRIDGGARLLQRTLKIERSGCCGWSGHTTLREMSETLAVRSSIKVIPMFVALLQPAKRRWRFDLAPPTTVENRNQKFLNCNTRRVNFCVARTVSAGLRGTAFELGRYRLDMGRYCLGRENNVCVKNGTPNGGSSL